MGSLVHYCRGNPLITQEIAAEILLRISQGESLRSICRTEGFPEESSVRKRANMDEEFGSQYARARDAGMDARAERLLEIVQDVEPENVNAARLRFDAERWYLSKMAPKTYGDRPPALFDVAQGTELKITVTGVKPNDKNS